MHRLRTGGEWVSAALQTLFSTAPIANGWRVGIDLTACSQPTGCPDGLVLSPNQPVQTTKAELGGGNNVVFTSTSQFNAVVKVKIEV